MLPTRGTARLGGFLNGIVRLSALEADVRRPDAEYGNRFSLFTTTTLHEIGHAIFETALSASQQDIVMSDYLETLDAGVSVPAGEPSDQGTQHLFIDFLVSALLGYGRPPRSAGASRRRIAAFGLDLWRQ
ncbi:MAG: hypothetical protein HY332_07650 [Chloroflexi bacterium]|nr:hypothetical protein [Chloroflexota bacterium]